VQSRPNAEFAPHFGESDLAQRFREDVGRIVVFESSFCRTLGCTRAKVLAPKTRMCDTLGFRPSTSSYGVLPGKLEVGIRLMMYADVTPASAQNPFDILTSSMLSTSIGLARSAWMRPSTALALFDPSEDPSSYGSACLRGKVRTD